MEDCDPNTVLQVSVMKDTNKDEEPNKDPCPICLSLISQHSSSYLDRCFHRFCYKCILRWIQVVSSRSTSLRQPSSVKCPLCKEEDVEIIMHHILGVIESFTRSSYSKQTTHSAQQKQQEFKVIVADAALPFLTARTKRFVDEMELFIASGLAVEYYDRAYRRCLGWKQHGETSEDGEQISREQEPIASHLYILDEDLDEIDWAEG
ncbi:unnamed protein product [Amaranthus hypochondriacus]